MTSSKLKTAFEAYFLVLPLSFLDPSIGEF